MKQFIFIRIETPVSEVETIRRLKNFDEYPDTSVLSIEVIGKDRSAFAKKD